MHETGRFTTGLASEPAFVTTFIRPGITNLKRALNTGLLPNGYYALAEQIAGFGREVLALGGPTRNTFIEPTGVGERLSDVALSLASDSYVPVALEATYQSPGKTSLPSGARH